MHLGSVLFKVELEELAAIGKGGGGTQNTLGSAVAEFPVFLQILKLNLEGTLKLLILPLKYAKYNNKNVECLFKFDRNEIPSFLYIAFCTKIFLLGSLLEKLQSYKETNAEIAV